MPQGILHTSCNHQVLNTVCVKEWTKLLGLTSETNVQRPEDLPSFDHRELVQNKVISLIAILKSQTIEKIIILKIMPKVQYVTSSYYNG